MYDSWLRLGFDTVRLGLEAQTVVALRLAKLSCGGAAAQAEAQRMVTEKLEAAAEAAMTLATGGTAERVVRDYRRKVQANARRLSRG
ncbi:hypothetical protein [Methylobacterium frigidaeris]|uniref:Uncharacterized protein n=1 Tax=Methylobacterium frigidaeris TaxID=2038277 RepID=A0AA37H8F0_9HYPH|nr:hypothetical protein [Methylobacterium frigidaeris]PIK74364.1 hypothetical protein CS379_02930 [Methylobacterium frigidaeris]GJD61235.1 hypothetical protein MPEAHAMD_1375 [Methylobacterium frigidaeris]